jgi:transglutaminase-like putative cysteine protease
MKYLLILAAALLQAYPCSAETLKLRSGAERTARVEALDGELVKLSDGSSLPRAEVAEIHFAAGAAAPARAAAAASPVDKAAGEYFVRAAALAKAFPGANGVVLLDSGEYRLNPDGTSVYRNRQVRQILKESLKQAWGQVIACAEEGRERVKITRATVYLPDGRTFPLDPSAVKTSKPQSAGGDFFVSGSVCTQYSMPNMQVGAVVDYETETETYNPFRKDFFFPQWGFQDSEGPVGLSEVAITVPEGQELVYSARNFGVPGAEAPAVSSAEGYKTYRWRLENVAPIVGEPAMTSYEDYAPFVRGAVFKDWDRIFDWLGGMHAERTKASPELEKFTLDLVKGLKTDEEKAAKIYHYVQKEIRYIAVKVGVASGWGGYDANVTWKRRYGCCIDKALLLTAMLKTAGIKASPVLINTNNMQEINYDVPQIGFDHAIAVAEIGGRKVFLDSTNYDYRYPEVASFDYGLKVMNIFDKKLDYVPVPDPRENGSYYDYRITLSSSGTADVTEKMRYTGSREGALRSYYRSIKKEEQKQVFQGMAKSAAPSSALVSYQVNAAEDLEKPFTLEYSYTAADYPRRAGDILIVKLPDFEIEPYRINEISLSTRRYPIEYDASMGRYQEYEVSLPPSMEVVSLPESITLAGKYAHYAAGCAAPEKGRISCRVSWERPGRLVPPEDYAEYKAFIEKAASYSKSQIFLRDLAAKVN